MAERYVDEGSVELRFDGKRYGYWQKVNIRETVDDLCASVQLEVVRAGTGSNLGTSANTVFEVLIDDELVTTARSDVFVREVGHESHEINFEGRSLGRELVDCQYSITLAGLKLGEIVKRICSTFKVPVTIDAPTAVVPNFSMQCELPANALINAVRAANLLLYPLPNGGLILTAPSAAAPVATLVYGDHFLHYRFTDEHRLRFSEFRIKSFDYDNNQPLKGHVVDEEITFFRPMHIVADRHGGSIGSCERRAQLECNRRKARAHRLEVQLQGWRHAGGLWRKNTQVRVVIPPEDTDAVFMIGEVHRRLDDQGGRLTVLMLMDRNAFMGEEKKKSRRGVTAKGKTK